MTQANEATYEVELLKFGDRTTGTTALLDSPSAVEALVEREVLSNSVVTIVCLRGQVDWGNFILFSNQEGQAFVRVLEHRGFHAKAPVLQDEPASVAFTDDQENQFTVDGNKIVPLRTALDALRHWLPSQERWQGITWGDD